MRGRVWLVAILVSLVAHPSRAEEFILAGEVFGSYNRFAMKQVNADTRELNRDNSADFDRIEGAVAGGLGARFWVTPNWLFIASWEPLYGETQSTVFGVDPDGELFVVDNRYNVDGSSVQMGAAYFIPSPTPIRLGVGVGVGYYWVRGEAAIEHQTGPSLYDFETHDTLTGNAPGAHVMGLGEWTVSPGFAITALAGYRLAKIKDTRAGGESTSPKTETDYSGFMGRLGMALYLPLR